MTDRPSSDADPRGPRRRVCWLAGAGTQRASQRRTNRRTSDRPVAPECCVPTSGTHPRTVDVRSGLSSAQQGGRRSGARQPKSREPIGDTASQDRTPGSTKCLVRVGASPETEARRAAITLATLAVKPLGREQAGILAGVSDLNEIRDAARIFIAERDWQQFQDPKWSGL